MNIQRCENGHFYDADMFATCPHCKETKLMLGDSPENVTVEVTSQGEAVQAGRDYNVCKVVLKDPHCARVQAKFEALNGDWYITDLNSTNGTKVNGERLDPEQKRKLDDGDVIAFADTDSEKYYYIRQQDEAEPTTESEEVEPAPLMGIPAADFDDLQGNVVVNDEFVTPPMNEENNFDAENANTIDPMQTEEPAPQQFEAAVESMPAEQFEAPAQPQQFDAAVGSMPAEQFDQNAYAPQPQYDQNAYAPQQQFDAAVGSMPAEQFDNQNYVPHTEFDANGFGAPDLHFDQNNNYIPRRESELDNGAQQPQFDQNAYAPQQPQFDQSAYAPQQPQFDQNAYAPQPQFDQNAYAPQPQFDQNAYAPQPQEQNNSFFPQPQFTNNDGPVQSGDSNNPSNGDAFGAYNTNYIPGGNPYGGNNQ